MIYVYRNEILVVYECFSPQHPSIPTCLLVSPPTCLVAACETLDLHKIGVSMHEGTPFVTPFTDGS